MQKQTELGQAILAVPPLSKRADEEEHELYVQDLTSIKQNYHAAMTARWKAGEFDGLFGAFKARGVMLKPPLKIYVEQP